MHCRRYERELRRLRAELAQKSRDLVDKRLVLQVGGRGVEGWKGGQEGRCLRAELAQKSRDLGEQAAGRWKGGRGVERGSKGEVPAR